MRFEELNITGTLQDQGLELVCRHCNEAHHVGVSELVHLGVLAKQDYKAYEARLRELLGYDVSELQQQLQQLLPAKKYHIHLEPGESASWRPKVICEREDHKALCLDDVVELDSIISTVDAEVNFSNIYRSDNLPI